MNNYFGGAWSSSSLRISDEHTHQNKLQGFHLSPSEQSTISLLALLIIILLSKLTRVQPGCYLLGFPLIWLMASFREKKPVYYCIILFQYLSLFKCKNRL